MVGADQGVTESSGEDITLPSPLRLFSASPSGAETEEDQTVPAAPDQIPPSWLLLQHFEGRLDLAAELLARYPALPLMTIMRVRRLDRDDRRGTVSMMSGDGASSLMVEWDRPANLLGLGFGFNSFLAARFRLDDLSDADRQRWQEQVSRDQDGFAFLWGRHRWTHDYCISVTRRQFLSLFAFSPYGLESAVRLTPEVRQQFLDWMASLFGP